MKIVVTGASGFVGNFLCKTLLLQGHEVHGFCGRFHEDLFLPYQYCVDLTQKSLFIAQIEKINPDAIVHLAANKTRTHEKNIFSEIVRDNMLMTLNVINAACQIKALKKCIFLGSAEEYGRQSLPFDEHMMLSPLSAYGCAKACQTYSCQTAMALYGLPCVILRPSIVYGPGQDASMFVGELMQALTDNRVFDMTAGEQTRDFIYVTDLVDAILLALQADQACHQIFNIGYGRSYTLSEVANKIGLAWKKMHLIRKDAKPYRASDIMHYAMNINRARTLLGFEPRVDLDQGIMHILHAMRNQS